jgi:hypothetical protein
VTNPFIFKETKMPETIIGMYFCQFDHDWEKLHRVGQVIAKLDHGLYLVEVYSAVTGETNGYQVYDSHKLTLCEFRENKGELADTIRAHTRKVSKS